MTKNGGFDFQAEFIKEVEASELAGSEAQAPASAELPLVDEEKVEQPTVENGEEGGLFDALDSETTETEQSDEELHQVKVNGETFNVSLRELKDGYQRQADYTQGKQELAKLKEQAENALILWEALEKDYAGTVKNLMSRANIRGAVAPKSGSAGEDIDALVERKLQESLANDPRIQAFEQEASLRQIENIFTAIEEDFDIKLSRSDKQAVLERAERDGLTNLKAVVAMMLQERERKLAQQKNVELVSTIQGRRSGEQEDFIPHVEYYSTPSEAWAASAREGNLTD